MCLAITNRNPSFSISASSLPLISKYSCTSSLTVQSNSHTTNCQMIGGVSDDSGSTCRYLYRLLHKSRYLRYFIYLKNGTIITKGAAQDGYCAIMKVSKTTKIPLICAITQFSLWLMRPWSLLSSYGFLVKLVQK